jgi:hypothetical protein
VLCLQFAQSSHVKVSATLDDRDVIFDHSFIYVCNLNESCAGRVLTYRVLLMHRHHATALLAVIVRVTQKHLMLALLEGLW